MDGALTVMARLRNLLGVIIAILSATAVPAAAQTFDVLHAFRETPGYPGLPLVEPDGTIYGITARGGAFNRGTLFRRSADGTFSTLHDFDDSDGTYPVGLLTRGADGALYGVTSGDNFYSSTNATIFRWNGAFTTVHRFDRQRDGYWPTGNLTLGQDGALYGTATGGGPLGYGTLFKWDGTLTVLHAFQGFTFSNGAYPAGTLVVESDGTVYGTTQNGGTGNGLGGGTLYKWKGNLTILHRFTSGSNPSGVIKATDGALYGTTGASLFRWNGTLIHLKVFNYSTTGLPTGGVVQAGDGAIYGTLGWSQGSPFGSVFRWNGALSTALTFDGADGSAPVGLVRASDGALYGALVAKAYPSANRGGLFRIDVPGGNYQLLHAFLNTQPSDLVSLVYGDDGALYGTTSNGGAHGHGTFFRIDTNGTFTVLHAFDQGSGAWPGVLTKGIDGTIHGRTTQGGPSGYGTQFRWNGALTFMDDPTSWEGVGVQGDDGAWYVAGGGGGGDYGSLWRWDENLTVLHTFVWEDGAYPQGVSKGSAGALYGRTRYGGEFNGGTLYKWQGGQFYRLHSFVQPSDEPWPPTVLEGSDGALYGTLLSGLFGWGSIFRWDPATGLTAVHDFSGTDGAVPYSGVIQGNDGALYGTTYAGQSTSGAGWGTVFRWHAGTLTTLHQFTYTDGAHPTDLLIKGGADGAVYGFTREGGPHRKGVIFRVTPPDETAPLVALVGGPADGTSFYFGSVPPAPTCVASDTQSGLSGECTVSGYDTSVGSHTVTATASDRAGNQASASITYTVLPLTLSGLYQPIDMNDVWNVVKNGSTIPLTFEVFAGTTELTDASLVVQPLTATQLACDGGLSDEVELLATGGTSLRYDASVGRFVYNWQTPRRAGYCYTITIRLLDGSSVSAKVRTR